MVDDIRYMLNLYVKVWLFTLFASTTWWWEGPADARRHHASTFNYEYEQTSNSLSRVTSPTTLFTRLFKFQPTLSSSLRRGEDGGEHDEGPDETRCDVVHSALGLRRRAEYPPLVERVDHAVALGTLEQDQRDGRDGDEQPEVLEHAVGGNLVVWMERRSVD